MTHSFAQRDFIVLFCTLDTHEVLNSKDKGAFFIFFFWQMVKVVK